MAAAAAGTGPSHFDVNSGRSIIPANPAFHNISCASALV
jgi:hypothetical protein